jgi:hypothetical protein
MFVSAEPVFPLERNGVDPAFCKAWEIPRLPSVRGPASSAGDNGNLAVSNPDAGLMALWRDVSLELWNLPWADMSGDTDRPAVRLTGHMGRNRYFVEVLPCFLSLSP